MKTRQLLATALLFLFAATPPALAGESAEKPGTATTDEEIKAFKEMFGKGPQEEDVYRTDRLLVTATGSQKPVHLAPSVASVITADDILAMGATTLDEVLESVPGLHVGTSALNRMNAMYLIRGIANNQNSEVLLLMNGVSFSTVLNGSRVNTFSLPVAMISRVEVIRGPGSALYGADAFAGTINIITKDGFEIDGFEVGERAGSFGTTDTWLQYGADIDGWNIALSAEHFRNDGDNKRIITRDYASLISPRTTLAPGQAETDDRILNTHLALAKGKWGFKTWGWFQNDGGVGQGSGQAVDPVGTCDISQILSELTYNNADLYRDWELGMRLSYLYSDSDLLLRLFPPGTRLPIGADGNLGTRPPATGPRFTTFTDGVLATPSAEEHQLGADFSSIYTGVSQHRGRVGAGLKKLTTLPYETKNFGPGVLNGTSYRPVMPGTLYDLTGTPDIYMQDQDRSLWYLLIQDEWSFIRNWELTAGLRYDSYSDFGGTLNPRVALVWETLPELTTKLLYGTAFRPPSFQENYFINNPVALGNPNLDPETIETLEFAVDYQPSSFFHGIVSLFTYDIDGLMLLVPDPTGGTSRFQNAKDQKGKGFEVEIYWQLRESLQLESNFSLQRSEDKQTGEIVPYAPGIKFYANLNWEFLPKWSLSSQYYWLGDYHRASTDNRTDPKDHDLVNLALRRKNLFKDVDLALIAKNIFDEDYREPSQVQIPNDLPMEGRAIFGELRVKF